MSAFSPIRKVYAAATAFVLAFASLALGIVTPSAAADSYSFTRCVEDKRAANVLVMMDETGSVFKSDSGDLRVAGAEVLIDRLQRVATVYETPIKVMLSGFGDNFVERSSGWVELKSGSTAGVDTLTEISRKWKDKTPNSRETDMLSGLDGATKALDDIDGDVCKLFVFFKDGVDFQSFNKTNPSDIPSYPEVFDLLKKGKNAEAEKLAVEEICRVGGLADGLRGDDNIYTFGVALKPTTGQDAGYDNFRKLIEGGCGHLAPKGKVIDVTDATDLPSVFGSALDPDFKPSQYRGEFDVTMKRALTSVNILSSGISAFSEFSITLPSSCTDKTPISFKQGEPAAGRNIAGAVDVVAKWLGSTDSKAQTLNITLTHTNLLDDACWVGTWHINPGNDNANSSLYFDADLSAIATFKNENAVLVKQSDGTAISSYELSIQRPSNKQGVDLGELDPDLTFEITGFVRDAATKTRQPSSLDSAPAITQANFVKDQTISVKDLPLGNYELVLTMTVDVKGFNQELSPISTQRLIKIGTPAAAPTIASITDFGDIDGSNRKKATVQFVGSKDDDFEIQIAAAGTKVVATRFPKNLEYELFLPAGASDNIRIPKGQTVSVDVELAVKLPEGKTEVNAGGKIRGDLYFTAKALSVTQEDSLVRGEFRAIQIPDANLISQLLFTVFFMLVCLAFPLLLLVLITRRLSRFPDSEVAGKVTAAVFEVRYANGVVTNASELIEKAGNLAYFPLINVAPNRKSVEIGGFVFEAKVTPFAMKAVSHAELTDGSAIGQSSTDAAKPYLSLNLGSEWVFFTGIGPVDFLSQATDGSGHVALVVHADSANAPALMNDFLNQSGKALDSLKGKRNAGIIGDESSGFGNVSNPGNSGGNDNGFIGI